MAILGAFGVFKKLNSDIRPIFGFSLIITHIESVVLMSRK